MQCNAGGGGGGICMCVTCFDTGDAFGAEGGEGVEEVEGPLAVADEEAAGVDPDPAVLLEEEVVEAVDDKVALGVLGHGHLEGHVSEDGVAVHPPDPLHVRVVEHHLAQQRQLGPEGAHLLLKRGHVVEKLKPVKARVVNPVLEELEVVEVAQGVGARPRLRPGHEQRLNRPAQGHVPTRVARVPILPLRIPVRDLRPERIRRARVPLLLVHELAPRGVVRHRLLHLRQHARPLRLDNLLPQVRHVRRAAPEHPPRPHRPAQHQHRNKPAQNRNLERVQRLHHLAPLGRRQKPPRVVRIHRRLHPVLRQLPQHHILLQLPKHRSPLTHSSLSPLKPYSTISTPPSPLQAPLTPLWTTKGHPSTDTQCTTTRVTYAWSLT
jgi:hypothetical protein